MQYGPQTSLSKSKAFIKHQVANHTLITPQTLLWEQYHNFCQISRVGETIRKKSVVKREAKREGKEVKAHFLGPDHGKLHYLINAV